MAIPKQIKRVSPSELEIVWAEDLRRDLIPSLLLRKNCPCAACAEQRGDLNHSKPLSAPPKRSMLSIVSNTLEEQTKLLEVWGIGNYALGCRWGDGHSSGIYTFSKLRELGDHLSGAQAPRSDGSLRD